MRLAESRRGRDERDQHEDEGEDCPVRHCSCAEAGIAVAKALPLFVRGEAERIGPFRRECVRTRRADARKRRARPDDERMCTRDLRIIVVPLRNFARIDSSHLPAAASISADGRAAGSLG
jgi:hypothetical protein